MNWNGWWNEQMHKVHTLVFAGRFFRAILKQLSMSQRMHTIETCSVWDFGHVRSHPIGGEIELTMTFVLWPMEDGEVQEAVRGLIPKDIRGPIEAEPSKPVPQIAAAKSDPDVIDVEVVD